MATVETGVSSMRRLSASRGRTRRASAGIQPESSQGLRSWRASYSSSASRLAMAAPFPRAPPCGGGRRLIEDQLGQRLGDVLQQVPRADQADQGPGLVDERQVADPLLVHQA